MSQKVYKKWGYELIIHNDEKYCGKILSFKEGGKFSMHFHDKKTETWYVKKGSFIFTWIDTKTATQQQMQLYEEDIIEIARLLPHQLEALEESEIFEVSTQHFDNDSYRIAKGDSQV